ncbi:MAG: helix-turn-helix domain-containing protein [bacterium]
MIDTNRLKDIREDNDTNQEQMAKVLGVNRSTYSLWELGINIIPLK